MHRFVPFLLQFEVKMVKNLAEFKPIMKYNGFIKDVRHSVLLSGEFSAPICVFSASVLGDNSGELNGI